MFLIEIQSGPGFWNQMSPHKVPFSAVAVRQQLGQIAVVFVRPAQVLIWEL